MKIIKQGVKPKRYAWIGRWRCTACQSLIELEESDAEQVHGYGDDYKDAWVTARCPVCEQDREMSRSNWRAF